MKRRQIHCTKLATFASLALTTSLWSAVSIPVQNAGFEAPGGLAEGEYTGPADNWTAVVGGEDIGVWHPVSPADFTADPPAPEGDNVGYSYADAGDGEEGLSQILSGATGQLQADATYSLTVEVGDSLTYAGFPGYRVQLLAGGTVLAEAAAATITSGEGTFETVTVPYVYDVADAALVGVPLEIRLLSQGLVDDVEVEFDDVQLTVTLANPVANTGGPYSVSLGTSVSLDGSGSLPSDGQTITSWEWDLDNDGLFDELITGATPASISYDDLQSVHGMVVGDNTIKLRVTDDSSPTPKTSTTETTVAILPPVSMFTPSFVQPTFDGLDIGYFFAGSPSTNAGDKWFYENSGAGQAKGQTFTLTEDVLLKSVTYRLASTNKPATEAQPVDYLLRIGVIDTATNTFNPIHQETISQTTNWGERVDNVVTTPDTYGTWSLGSPVTLPALPAGTLYGVDLTMTANSWDWRAGIPYPLYNNGGNPYADGQKYTTPLDGAAGIPTDNVSYHANRDREFHLDLESTTIVDTTAPTLVSMGDNVAGGPIYEDQVQVIYTLTFDEAIDETTIDLADFENLGSGVSIDSVVSATHTAPYPLPSVIDVVLGISGTGTLNLGIVSGSDIADVAGNPMTSPVADDTTITINAGSNPAGGDRWWDGTTITGVTDGASQGGTATWDTTTTNWDRGFGFAGPVAWNNANNDNAIFGGSGGTFTLDAPMNVMDLTFENVNVNQTITGQTLNFAPGATITTLMEDYNREYKIQSDIAGNPNVRVNSSDQNKQLTFDAGASGNQALGVITNPYYDGVDGDKARINLRGDTHGNTIQGLNYINTNPDTGTSRNCHYGYLYKQGTGTWTINGDVEQGRIFCETGTLFINGKYTTLYAGFGAPIPSGFKLGGELWYWNNDARNQRLEMASGSILAPGNPAVAGGVGTIKVEANENRNDAWWFEMQTGSTLEWQVGASATDTVHMVRVAKPREIRIGDITISVLDAGGAPSTGDKLPVFTYDDGVTVTLGTVNIDISATSWTGTPTLVDGGFDAGDGFGTVYITGLSSGGTGVNDFSDWIAGFAGAAGDTSFGGDPDGDGIGSGLENIFDTDPGVFTAGVVSGVVDSGAGTFTFTHPQSDTQADDVEGPFYSWSTDLDTFTDDGTANGGTTVDFDSVVTGGVATVTATVTGTAIDKLFVQVSATQFVP